MDRPDYFELEPSHYLRDGAMLLGLGRGGGGLQYYDDSGLCNHGTLTNTVPETDWVWSDYLGRWYQVPGDSGYITGPLPFMPVDNWTIQAWLKPTTASTGTTAYALFVGAENRGYGIRWRDGKWYIGFPGIGAVVGVVEIAAGTVGAWQHVAICRRSGTAFMYINGTEYLGTTETPTDPTAAYYVGSYVAGTLLFTGSASDAAIYRRALSPAEIAVFAKRSDPSLDGLIRTPGRRRNVVSLATTHRWPWQIRRSRRMAGAR